MDTINLDDLEVDIPIIDLKKCIIENTDHKFGECSDYVLVKIKINNNMIANCLLTRNQLSVGIKRAIRNPEDCQMTESFKNYIENLTKGEL